MKKLDNLYCMGIKIICVLMYRTPDLRCVYRVYSSDGGYIDYLDFKSIPEPLQEWIRLRNNVDYVVPFPWVFISGCKVQNVGGNYV